MLLFFLVNLFIGFIGFCINKGGGYETSIWFPLAKAAGFALDFNLAIVVLPTLRSLQAMLRNIAGLDTVIPFVDDPIAFHRLVGIFIVVLSLLHTAFHCLHANEIHEGTLPVGVNLGPFLLPGDDTVGHKSIGAIFFDPSMRWAPFTGVVLLAAFILFAVTALPVVRRRALGGYNIFMNVHKMWPACYVLLVIHAPQILIWLLFPFLIIIADKVAQYRRRHTRVHLRKATLLQRDVVRLEFEIPRGFTYQAGQYIMINFHEVSLKGWHPFTISSCPEDPVMTVHVRAPDAFDWCSRMRRRVIDASLHCVDPDRPDGPVAVHVTAYVGRRGGATAKETSSCPAIERCMGTSPGAGADLGVRLEGLRVAAVVRGGPADQAGVTKGMTITRMCGSVVRAAHEVSGLWRGAEGTFRADFKSIPPPRPGTSVEFAAGRHPRSGKLHCDPSAVQYPGGRRVDGSSGVMTVPTPPAAEELDRRFDALLPGVQAFIDGPYGAPSERVWAFDVVMLVGTGIGVTPFASIIRQINLRAAQCRRIDDSGAKGLGQVRDSLARGLPTRVYFYWICRSTAEFEWFHELLEQAMDASESDDRYRVRVSVFWTETGEVSNIRRVSWLRPPHRQFHGRPKWASCFRDVRDAHHGEKVGCFLCGPPAIERELRKEAKAHSQRPSEGGTSFLVCSENF